jgi:hypothetical protein
VSDRPDDCKIDKTNVVVIGHISIRDPDTGEVILRQRDKTFEKVSNEQE